MKKSKDVSSYAHADKDRPNNPPVGLVTAGTDPDAAVRTLAHDPHIDPQLSWGGKAEHASFEVPTVSLHVHERVDPKTIMDAVRRRRADAAQPSLFDLPTENPPIHKAIEFYRHRHSWSNRLIAGDSLLVMNSLLEKEGMAQKVQTVYMDPPYGITYGSNFQPFVSKRSADDGRDEDLTQEPEQLRAFRDTWELGIHSYLTYLRDRLFLARELLTPTGSCFLQIGKTNVHRAAMLMDEVFGAENRVASIAFATSSGTSAATLPEVAHYLLWYARQRSQVKYRQLYERLTRAEVVGYFSSYVMVELPDSTRRKLTREERFDPDRYLPRGARVYRRMNLTSQGWSKTDRSDPYEFQGQQYHCGKNRHWAVSREGMDHLARLGRLEALPGQTSLMWRLYEDEVAGRRINNLWAAQMPVQGKVYVVQTAKKAVQRAILMSSDPGDLVFDPTCGSGTTAFVAEQWGRRWISCDTSRVALAIARQRLMTAQFSYYRLARPEEGVGAGFEYKSVPRVSAGILAYDQPAEPIVLYDQPLEDRSTTRVSGPFTVEAVPAPTVMPIDKVPADTPAPADASEARVGASARHADWCAELQKTGIRGRSGRKLLFSRLETLPAADWLHADGEVHSDSPPDFSIDAHPRRTVVSFGPTHAPLEPRQVERALEEAYRLVLKPKIVVFAAFQFDPEAAKTIDEMRWPGTTLIKAQMNADLLTADLKKKRASNESFWLIGQPDVLCEQVQTGPNAGRYRITVQGFDYFDVRTGNLESGGADRIACWMLDPNYDGRSLFARQVFFPMAGAKEGWQKLAKNLKAVIDPDLIEKYRGTESLPFEAGDHRRAAVKIIDDRGIESLKVLPLE